jgi:hypothetical protein
MKYPVAIHQATNRRSQEPAWTEVVVRVLRRKAFIDDLQAA